MFHIMLCSGVVAPSRPVSPSSSLVGRPHLRGSPSRPVALTTLLPSQAAQVREELEELHSLPSLPLLPLLSLVLLGQAVNQVHVPCNKDKDGSTRRTRSGSYTFRG